jgi:hypothetical protein
LRTFWLRFPAEHFGRTQNAVFDTTCINKAYRAAGYWIRGGSFSLRLGHAAALTCHRHVIHYRGAASLPLELPRCSINEQFNRSCFTKENYLHFFLLLTVWQKEFHAFNSLAKRIY